ncbi:MAG: hypothetical protein CAPSK01_004278 [Candidatus Accumulibacter vicinus]|uniref:Uncharacterized protein n=1 Tax=Candidatus Accumulibacter vicinus TaxID=2954382 RepID=A0A084XV95_9PROT|nr:MAG: hypothetical protein CAPSK01_004278 [Candidatus Accumulibacter vicinus]
MATVGDQQDAHAGGALGEQDPDFVVEQRPDRADVPGAEALVTAVGFVAVAVRYPGAVAGIGDDYRIAGLGAGGQAADAGAHRRSRCLGVDQRGDGEAAATEFGRPVVGVIDAARQVVAGARIIVDADA